MVWFGVRRWSLLWCHCVYSPQSMRFSCMFHSLFVYRSRFRGSEGNFRVSARVIELPVGRSIACWLCNANANENLHNRLIFKLTFLKRLRLIVIGDNAKAKQRNIKSCALPIDAIFSWQDERQKRKLYRPIFMAIFSSIFDALSLLYIPFYNCMLPIIANII